MMRPPHAIRVAVDTGGTFTDLQIFDERSGETYELKTPTTPEDPSLGLANGLTAAAERFGFALGDIDSVTHGTTIATNALLQRKLPRGALIATEGFTDILEIGRHVRKDVYSLAPEVRPPLIARRDRFGLVERMDASGDVSAPIDFAALHNIAERIAEQKIATIAVCLINAHANPAHEIAVGDWLKERFPEIPVSLSSEISPEIREYERSSTVALNALLRPIVETYISNLAERLREIGVEALLYIIQSNGGVCSPEIAAAEPVRLFLSGPSGGAAAARHISARRGEPNMIAIDIGGTSTDVSIIRDGAIADTSESEIEGYALRLPMIEIRTIGAGGGSITELASGGQLRVGPASAGADPGPAAYGKGGSAPTVTDAHIVLGRLDPGSFFKGEMAIDGELARRAIEANIAEPLGISPEEAADGLTQLASVNMANAIRLSLFEKGMDPLDFSLLSFGGGGGLHAVQIAEEIGIGRILFPRATSTLSAYGLLWSHMVHDFVTACFAPAREAAGRVGDILTQLTEEARRRLTDDGVPAEDRDIQTAFDLRYRGQAFELTVGAAAGPPTEEMLERAIADFHQLHEQRYAYCQPEATVDLVAVRVRAVGLIRKTAASFQLGGAARPAGSRDVYLDGAWRNIAVHDYDALRPDSSLAGPAIIEQPYTTIFVPGGWHARATEDGDVQAERAS